MRQNWLTEPLPFELGMALVENPAALERYAAMGQAEKQQFIRNATDPSSRTAMQSYVQGLLSN